MNRLPEKLTFMRKQLNYSQGDIAAKINVSVTEYMHWENGTSLPSIQYMKRIADVYGIPVVMLLDNTMEVDLPPVSTESVEITFDSPAEAEKTKALNTVENLGATKPAELLTELDLSPTVSGQVVDEEEMAMSQTHPILRPEKPSKKKRMKTTLIILCVAVAAIGIVFGLLFALDHFSESSLSLSSVNRLALGDTYSLYIKKSGELQMYGQFPDKSLYDGSVQVSVYDSHAVGLKADGTVISNTNEDVSEWKDIVQIAAGRTHTAAINDDGEVLCTGSEAACKVEGWVNVTNIYAGNAVTLGISSDGTVHASGADDVDGISGIRSAAIGDSEILLVTTSGTVKSYSLTSAPASDVSSWSDIDEVAVGSDFAAGMTSKGKVIIVTEDENIKKKVESWNDIRYIAAHGTTIVAVDRSGNMYGAGDNSFGQYVDNTVEPEPVDTEVVQLDTVREITFTESTANIQIKWKSVTNADYYQVRFEPALDTEIPQTSSTSVSIPASSLTDGNTYQVTVTAYSNDTEKFKESEPAAVSYTYKSKTVTLDSPSNIRAESTAENWIIRWDPVENASYYMVSINGGEEYRTDENAFYYELNGFIDQSMHNLSIKACSDSSSYSESVASQAELIFELPVFSVTLNFTTDDEQEVERQIIQVKYGTHTLSEIASPDLYPSDIYELADPDRQVDIISDYGVDVSLKKIDSGGKEEN